MTSWIHVLSVFDRESGALMEEVELNKCPPARIRDVLAPEEDERPYFFDAHPLVTLDQVEALVDCLPAMDWDFQRLCYFIEANPV